MSKIWIVEDDILSLTVLSSFCQHMGFEVVELTSVTTARERLSRERPSLVVTDLEMPVTDGFELNRIVQQNYPGLPVILISSYSHSDLFRKIKSEGVFDFFEKPLDFSQFMRTIQRALGLSEIGSLSLKVDVEDRLSELSGGYVKTSILGELHSVMGSERLAEVWAQYRIEADQALVQMMVFAEKRKFSDLKDEAHKLAGSSATLGLTRMHERARLIERLASLDEAGVSLLVADTRSDFATTEFMINEYLERFAKT